MQWWPKQKKFCDLSGIRTHASRGPSIWSQKSDALSVAPRRETFQIAQKRYVFKGQGSLFKCPRKQSTFWLTSAGLWRWLSGLSYTSGFGTMPLHVDIQNNLIVTFISLFLFNFSAEYIEICGLSTCYHWSTSKLFGRWTYCTFTNIFSNMVWPK